MFSNKFKGNGIVIGPVKLLNHQGDHLCLRDNLTLFKIHRIELSQQQYQRELLFEQSNNRNKYLAFDKNTGDLIAVVYNLSKFFCQGVVIHSINCDRKWMLGVFNRSALDAAPRLFKIKVKRYYHPPTIKSV